MRKNIRRMLESKERDYSASYSIVLVSNGISAYGACSNLGAPILAIVDHKLRVAASGRTQSVTGLHLVRQLRDLYPSTKLILYSGFADGALTMQAFAAGANMVVHKGDGEPENLLGAIYTLIGPPPRARKEPP